MEKNSVFSTAKIDEAKLKVALVKLKLSLDLFAIAGSVLNEDLAVLFRHLLELDLDNAKRNEKDALVTKLRKFLIGKKPQQENPKGQTPIEVKDIDKPTADSLGLVKFIAKDKSHGFVLSFNDFSETDSPNFWGGVGSSIAGNDISTGIEWGSLLIYEKQMNRRKEIAARVGLKFPVFVTNVEKSKLSKAHLLVPGYWKTAISLNQKLPSGFAVLSFQRDRDDRRWNVVATHPVECQKEDVLAFGLGLLPILLESFRAHKAEIELLVERLLSFGATTQLQEAYRVHFLKIRGKRIEQTYAALSEIGNHEFLAPLYSELADSLSGFSFVLWMLDKAKLPKEPHSPEDIHIWKTEVLDFQKWPYLQEIIAKLASDDRNLELFDYTLQYLLSKGWDIDSIEEIDAVKEFVVLVKTIRPEVVVTEESFSCTEAFHYIRLCLGGVIPSVSKEKVLVYLGTLPTNAEKAAYIESLGEEDIHSLYQALPELRNEYVAYLQGRFDQLFGSISSLALDIESNELEIKEVAWVSGGHCRTHLDFKEMESAVAAMVDEAQRCEVIVGQNIKRFDLPILQRLYEFPIPSDVWDMLEVEMLLNPLRRSFGLRTTHSAKDDALLAERLFRNQVARLCADPVLLDKIRGLLPAVMGPILEEIGQASIWQYLGVGFLEAQADELFRPEASRLPLQEATFEVLEKALAGVNTAVVVAPRLLWSSLANRLKITFYDEGKLFSQVVSLEAVDRNFDALPLEQNILRRYIEASDLKGRLPFFELMPMAMRLLVGEEKRMLCCQDSNEYFLRAADGICCVSPENLEPLEALVAQHPEIKVVLLGEEISSITSKLQLGESFDAAYLFEKMKAEPGLWIQMSGGKKIIEIDFRLCGLLGVENIPVNVDRIWLEKIGRGRFSIWCTVSIDSLLASIDSKTIVRIPLSSTVNAVTNISLVVARNLQGFSGLDRRVNPGSLFRHLYWAYQFKALEGLRGNPKVLLVNDASEIRELRIFARQQGYFVPDEHATIARQLELLHGSAHANRCLVSNIKGIEGLIQSNYLDSLDLVWDSFLLEDARVMLQQKMPLTDLEHETAQSDYDENGKVSKTSATVFKLLEAFQPIIDFLGKFIANNHFKSRLILLDPRLSDYPGIQNSLGANVVNVSLWGKAAEYEAAKEAAARVFDVGKAHQEINFDLHEAKEILRQIFLKSEKEDQVYEWRDYQHPYLNAILPAKENLLISLPTGAGKSILFQGPALFRAALSDKLTLVVSPLKALITDQVENLQERGFYSNVDCLSGDRGQLETRDTLRRVAGGEITLLYVTPERFRSRAFEDALQTRMQADNGLEFVVFDEAHCISQWGQEFRPDYLNVARRVSEFRKIPIFDFRVLLFSATISEQVFLEISGIIPEIKSVEGAEKSYNPVRDHIGIDFEKVSSDDRLEQVASYLGNGQFNPDVSRAIVFVRSRANTEDFAIAMPEVLKRVCGADCRYAERVGTFHAGMDAEDRRETYERYKKGDISLLFATKAFGMGMDIPNIHYLCHYAPPGTFEDFLQEIGRAGRNEKERLDAGFSESTKLIRTKCFTGPTDFKEQKDLLHRSRISWLEVKEIKECVEAYIGQFRPLRPDPEHAVAIPFNLYALDRESLQSDIDTKFRIGLHWLEKLGRIKLGYFTITHLEFGSTAMKALSGKLGGISDTEVVAVCKALLEIGINNTAEADLVQIPVAQLRSKSGVSPVKLFDILLRAHAAGLIDLRQTVIVEGTKIRSIESEYALKNPKTSPKYPALRIIFEFARTILDAVPSFEQRVFEGEELDRMLYETIESQLPNGDLPWVEAADPERKAKAIQNYRTDLIKKRSKHAFTILRMLEKVKHESKMETVIDSSRKVDVHQIVHNGYGKKDDWQFALKRLEEECVAVLNRVTEFNLDKNTKVFNWPDLVKELKLGQELKNVSNILFVLSVLGYVRSSGLMPSGIEVFLQSIEAIKEQEIQSEDQKVYSEFEETKRVRELKLVALEVLSKLPTSNFDSFIRKYFECSSSGDLIRLLESELDPSDPVLVGFRQEAIKFEEDRLNVRQRDAYDADVDRHVNVMAGPGTGKTHTLTLRVARLVHHLNVPPDEILVLAYNRAVVSELKERLSKLFGKLGYDSLAKKLKIFTFHGLSKRYCKEEIEGKEFDQWEPTLRNLLKTSPGRVMGQIGRLRYILVDEFQDINETRIEILDQFLQNTNAKLFIIGDPNQSIYGYERKKEGHPVSPWPYYEKFNAKFDPIQIALVDNHRSYPKILELASKVLELPEDHADLIPRATKEPSEEFLGNYVEEYDTTIAGTPPWASKVVSMLEERIDGKAYSQIAILFRSNNEVYLGFQRIKQLLPAGVRVRIQGSLAYEFTRIRECHAVLMEIRKSKPEKIDKKFSAIAHSIVSDLSLKFPNWNQYYLRVMQALVLEFIEEQDSAQPMEMLLEFIQDITRRDDGQLFKIYEKHRGALVKTQGHETEIVLTTMHKVKGLEFDAVVVPASFANLPLNQNPRMTHEELLEELGEERRLTFVSYTRAKYRLVIYRHLREKAMLENKKYTFDEAVTTTKIGRPVASGIEKLWIGWTARNGIFQNVQLREMVESKMQSGDPIILRKIINGGNSSLVVYSGMEEDLIVGALAQNQAPLFTGGNNLGGLVVHEVVTWTYAETVESDAQNGTNFAYQWCGDAKAQGFIYLVDFAGYGKPAE